MRYIKVKSNETTFHSTNREKREQRYHDRRQLDGWWRRQAEATAEARAKKHRAAEEEVMIATGDNWRNRLFVAVAFLLVQEAHKILFVAMPNNDGGQLLYHGSAVLADFWLMYLVYHCLHGRIVLDLCALSFASMVANAVQWCLYVAYFPPTIYNFVVTGVGYVQFVRLIMVDRDFNNSWRRLAGGYGHGSTQLSFGKNPR